jgi:flagella basal body P-ring formation protein FlgA
MTRLLHIILGAILAGVVASPVCAQTSVRGDWIALGDVAPVTGEAASVLLGPAPPPGQTLALDPAFVISVAKRSGVYLAIPLDEPVLVTREGASSARSAPQAPRAPIAPQAGAPPVVSTPAVGSRQTPVLMLTKDLPRGARLTPGDVEWAPQGSLRELRGAPASLDDVIGLELKRSLRAGLPVLETDLKAPSLIRKGEPVKLYYTAAGLRLSVDGLAQNDAGAGDSVRILNSYSRRSIDAVATAVGEARVSQR